MATIIDLNSTVVAMQAELAAVKADQLTTASTLSTAMKETDSFFILFAGSLVFVMQAGFATLEAGSVRDKNVRNVLLKNALDACVGALVWYLFGYGIATGGNAFIGTTQGNFALSGLDDTMTDYSKGGYDWCAAPTAPHFQHAPNQWGIGSPFTMRRAPDTLWPTQICDPPNPQPVGRRISFFFSFTFAAAASTIVSGAVAERCQIGAYLIYTVFITGFIYPIVVHWVWDPTGFLSAFNSNHIVGGMIDFAGSGVVHMTGGIAGFVGASMLGPRLGRWDNPDEFEGHSTPLQIIGTFLLWFGWYGFNGGSTLYIHGYGRDMARVSVCTTLSAAMSGSTGLLIKKFFPEKLGGSHTYDVGHTCNSILAGLVGITAGCATVSAPGALLIGFLSSFVYHGASCLMRKLKIDDPLDAFAVHGACGCWACIATGLFSVKAYSYAPNSGSPMYATIGGSDGGAFTGETVGATLGAELVGVLIELVWVGGCSTILFGTLKATAMLRVSKEVEMAGLDASKHGGSAYTMSKFTVDAAHATV